MQDARVVGEEKIMLIIIAVLGALCGMSAGASIRNYFAGEIELAIYLMVFAVFLSVIMHGLIQFGDNNK